MRKSERIKRKKRKKMIRLGLVFLFLSCCTGTYLVLEHSNLSAKGQRNKAPTSESKKTQIKDTNSLETESSSSLEMPTSQTSKTQETEKQSKPKLADHELLASAGQVAYGVYYFNDGEYLTNNNTQRMPAASVIKVFIMEYLYNQAATGTLKLDQLIQGQSMTDLITKMIQNSDNTATNILIDQVGMETLNQYFASQGYADTVLERKMLDDNARNQGLDNYTSLTDTLNFLKKIYQNKETYPNNKMLEIMTGQKIGTKIRRHLPENVTVANKTGELPGVENDIGIVYGNGKPFAIVVLSQEVYNSEQTREAIGNFAYEALTS